MFLENAAGKLIEFQPDQSGAIYYDIVPASNLPGSPRPYEAPESTSTCFLLGYDMPYLNRVGRKTEVPNYYPREHLKPEDVTHVALSFDGEPHLAAIKFKGAWIKSQP